MRDADGRSYEELCALAEALRDQSRLSESLSAKKDALSLLEHELGPYHPKALTETLEYSRLLAQEKKWIEALEMSLSVKDRVERALTSQHPLLSEAYRTIADIYHAQELLFEATLIVQREIEIRKQSSTNNVESLVDSFSLLATLYEEQGLHEESQRHLRNAIELVKHESSFPVKPYVELAINLATSYESCHMVTESIRFFELALQTLHTSDFRSRDTAIECSMKLAQLYGEVEDWEQRERSLRHALDEMSEHKTSEELALELYHALVYHYQEARGHTLTLKEVTAAYSHVEPFLVPHSPQQIDALSALGECCYLAGEYEQAQTILEGVRQSFHDKNDSLEKEKQAEILHNLGTTYVAVNRLRDAEKCFEEALSLQGKEDQKDTIARAHSLYALGTVEKMIGEAEKAMVHLEECLKSRKNALGIKHPLTKQVSRALERMKKPEPKEKPTSVSSAAYSISHIATEFSTALLFINEQNFREAHKVLHKILHVLERQLGSDHEDLVPVLEQLSLVQKALGREDESLSYAKRAANIQG